MTTQQHLNRRHTTNATGASMTTGCCKNESAPKVVFLPFSESLMKSPRQHTACWQQRSELASTRVTNYPADLKTNQTNSLMLVPFDHEYMSLSVLRHGRWESLNQ